MNTVKSIYSGIKKLAARVGILENPLYLSYVALLRGAGTANPTVKINKNDLGGGSVWVRESMGVYYTTTTTQAPFDYDKLLVVGQYQNNMWIALYSGANNLQGFYGVQFTEDGNGNLQFYLYVTDPSGFPIDLEGISNQYIAIPEIRYYNR